MAKKERRFAEVFTEGSVMTDSSTLFVDRETGVTYLFIKSGYGAGLTPLLDKDGKPVITEL